MNYANIYYDDTVNGNGFRTSIFVSGCKKYPPCEGCWNSEARRFNYGKEFNEITKQNIIDSLGKTHVKGISILGGEPTDNLKDGRLLDLVKSAKSKYPQKTIYCWTGYKFEDLIKDSKKREFLTYVDMLRDGEFIEELKDIIQYLGGSTNQRYISCKESIKQNKVIEYNFN